MRRESLKQREQREGYNKAFHYERSGGKTRFCDDLDILFCDYCGRGTQHIYVHGHYQCEDCKVNTIPCCEGENEI